jgi:pimeloyl-ACP methyl ester carboxylesterase
MDPTQFRHAHIAIGESSLHVVEIGDPSAAPVLFLHGWPQSWRAWSEVMALAAPSARAIAIDLPGIGGSTGEATDGSKRAIASVVHELIETMDLHDVTLVGHDAGGVVAYSYLRTYSDVARVVIMNSLIPGVDPWDEVLGNPYVWHIAFHSTPDLPERLVHGRQREYFDYFYDLLSPNPAAISDSARDEYAAAYASESALAAGFNWYRAFGSDARHLAKATGLVTTPLLFLAGDQEFGDIADYVAGFRRAGLELLDHAVIANAGHFSPEDAPAAVWAQIARFAGLPS